ncbi:MAG: MarR family transcriptional regulator [Planctomycetota bacterium]|nr:MarR family transcriptional regulator [Planctomycetota bacterium]
MPYDLTVSIGYHVHRAASGMRRELDARLAAHGVTSAQWGALVSIGRHGCATAADLARWMNLDRAGVSRVLTQLERVRLIERRPSADDRRTRRLRLSPKGAALLPTLEAVTASVSEDFLATFSPAERSRLLRLLSRVPSNVPVARAD